MTEEKAKGQREEDFREGFSKRWEDTAETLTLLGLSQKNIAEIHDFGSTFTDDDWR